MSTTVFGPLGKPRGDDVDRLRAENDHLQRELLIAREGLDAARTRLVTINAELQDLNNRVLSREHLETTQKAVQKSIEHLQHAMDEKDRLPDAARGFVEALLRDPSDADVIEIFADWCDDHGRHAASKRLRKAAKGLRGGIAMLPEVQSLVAKVTALERARCERIVMETETEDRRKVVRMIMEGKP